MHLLDVHLTYGVPIDMLQTLTPAMTDAETPEEKAAAWQEVEALSLDWERIAYWVARAEVEKQMSDRWFYCMDHAVAVVERHQLRRDRAKPELDATENEWNPEEYGHTCLLDCQECGKEFYGEHVSIRYCRACRRTVARTKKTEAQRERRVEQRGPLPNTCQHCGEAMESARKSRKYCSNRCRVAASRAKASPAQDGI